MTPSLLNRIVNGRTDLVFELVAGGMPATLTDPNGTSLIEWCAYYGDVSAIRFLLQQGESMTPLGENAGLSGAAFHGHWRLCEFLLEQGADVNQAAEDTGETPLHAALSAANRPSTRHVVEVLLRAGASVNPRTKPGAPTGSFMRDCRTKEESPLHRAAAFASVEVIRRLLAAGAVIDAKDMNGDTPLAWASWHLRPDAVLRALCYGSFSIHPQRNSLADHGAGASGMDENLIGKPAGT